MPFVCLPTGSPFWPPLQLFITVNMWVTWDGTVLLGLASFAWQDSKNVFSMRIQIGQIMAKISLLFSGREGRETVKDITYKKRLKACSTYIMQAKKLCSACYAAPVTLPLSPLCHSVSQKYHHFVLNSTEAFPLASFRALPRRRLIYS